MKPIFYLLLCFVSTSLYGQCGYIINYGVAHPIPCDFDYKKHIQDSLDRQEQIFIDLVNEDRERLNLPKFEYDKRLEQQVSDVRCKILVQKDVVFHPFYENKDYFYVDLVSEVYWNYMNTNIGLNSFINFKTSCKGHYEELTEQLYTKISVSFLPSRTNTETKSGKVYVVVALGY